MENKLPTKFSDLILVALKDLEAVEAQPSKYDVNMNEWVFKWSQDEVCQVCLAGSVMVGTLDIGMNVDQEAYANITPTSLYNLQKITSHDHDALMIIDYLRSVRDRDDVEEYLDDHYFTLPKEFVFPKTPDGYSARYIDNPAAFKQRFRDLAAAFKQVGL